MTDRVPCAVPFCRRTRAPDQFTEWLCGDHWRLVDARLRKLRRKILKRLQRGATGGNVAKLDVWTWERAKRQAIERAHGLDGRAPPPNFPTRQQGTEA